MSWKCRMAGRGTLGILALILAASGALRLGHGLGAAMALQAADPPYALSSTGGAPLQCPEPPAAVAAALRERNDTVSIREAALNDRLAALSLSELALMERMTELEAAESGLREALTIADGAAEKDLMRLTTVYEAMKPADAATLFEAMNSDFAAGFLGRMRPDAAAAVLSGMSPDHAYSISLLIAGRNATAPRG